MRQKFYELKGLESLLQNIALETFAATVQSLAVADYPLWGEYQDKCM